MSQEVLQRIFEEFEQADSSSTRQYQGSGLGLTIAKKFIEILGGQITVESQPGKGTIFKFFIPVEIGKQIDSDKTKIVIDNSKEKKEPQEKYKILVAEDDKFNQQAIEMMLEDACDITFADNGAEALDKFSPGKFDLIFTDIEMSVMDGCTFIDKLRETHKEMHTPVIAMTAWAMKDEKNDIMQHDFDDYITKPLDYDNLISIIKKYAATAKTETT